MLKLFWSKQYHVGLGEGHRFPMERYLKTFYSAKQRLPMDQVHFVDPSAISEELIRSSHCPEYVGQYFGGTLSDSAVRKIGFPCSPEFNQRTRKICGGTIEAVRSVLQEDPIACNLAGGFHHAFYGHGEGFCIFNDLVMGAKVAMEEFGIGKVLVVDLDVHQGNGTARMCSGDDRIFTYSVHGKNNYPFRKEKSDYDIELEDYMEDEEYLSVIRSTLPSIMSSVVPDLVLYQAGVDGLEGDRWGKLSLTREGLRRRNRLLFEECLKRRVPVVTTMGGGYGKDIMNSVDAQVDVFEDALEHLVKW